MCNVQTSCWVKKKGLIAIMRNSRQDEVHNEEANEQKDSAADSLSLEVLGQNSYVPTRKQILLLFVGLVFYIFLNLLGALFFQLIEKSDHEGLPHWILERKQQFLRKHNSCLTEEQLESFLEVSRSRQPKIN